jgi:hypothetical protein
MQTTVDMGYERLVAYKKFCNGVAMGKARLVTGAEWREVSGENHFNRVAARMREEVGVAYVRAQALLSRGPTTAHGLAMRVAELRASRELLGMYHYNFSRLNLAFQKVCGAWRPLRWRLLISRACARSCASAGARWTASPTPWCGRRPAAATSAACT